MSTFGDIQHSATNRSLVVVLVEPRDARNIGAVARAMSNVGVTALRLVNPSPYDQELARSVACWGAVVVEDAVVFSHLEDAIADMHEVVGFASDSGRHRIPQLLLPQWVDSLSTDPAHRIALVFGSEEQGLRREHFPFCQYLIRIPSHAANRSYNLAQSVLIALYTLTERMPGLMPTPSQEVPQSSEVQEYVQMVLKVAQKVGFLSMHSPHHIEELLVNVSRRGRLSTRELVVLKGLFGTIFKKLPG